MPHSPSWSAAQWMEWQKQAKSIESIAAYGWTFNFLVQTDGSESMEGMWVTSDYFHVLGLQLLASRPDISRIGDGRKVHAGRYSRLRTFAA